MTKRTLAKTAPPSGITRRRRKKPTISPPKPKTRTAPQDDLYPVLGILDECTNDQGIVVKYLIDWDGIDPQTGDKWKPTWEPAANVYPEPIEEWQQQKDLRDSVSNDAQAHDAQVNDAQPNNTQADNDPADYIHANNAHSTGSRVNGGHHSNTQTNDGHGSTIQAGRAQTVEPETGMKGMIAGGQQLEARINTLEANNTALREENRRFKTVAATWEEDAAKSQKLVKATGLLALIKVMASDKLQESNAIGWVTSEVLNGDDGISRHVYQEVEKLEEFIKAFFAGEAGHWGNKQASVEPSPTQPRPSGTSSSSSSAKSTIFVRQ